MPQAMRQTLDRQARAIAGMQVLLGIEPEPVADTYSAAGPPQQDLR
jgi:hypothetical protein